MSVELYLELLNEMAEFEIKHNGNPDEPLDNYEINLLSRLDEVWNKLSEHEQATVEAILSEEALGLDSEIKIGTSKVPRESN